MYLEGQEEVFLSRDQLSAINSIIDKESDTAKTQALIINYLGEILSIKDVNALNELVMTYDVNHLTAVLPTYPFKVKSFFWLTGPYVLLEIVFWSLFGLMANLMYSVTITNAFDKKRIPEHIGKIFYTPFSSIIIYLSLNALLNVGSISLNGVGKSVIVLSFILGFFTRRTIVFLGKIKDLILPVGKEGQEKEKNNSDGSLNEINGTVIINKVSDEIQEKNIEYTAIKITSLESDYVDVVNPDKAGAFSFKSVPNGNYKIESELVIEATRYFEEGHVHISNIEEPLDLHITLKKSELILK